MKIPLVKSRSEINDCPPLRCDKKHRKAALNVVGTKQRIRRLLFFISVIVCMPVFVYSQNEEKSDSTQFFTLEQCIHYAMQHQPGLNRSLLNTSIAKTTNAINLSGWLPQVNLIGSMIHYNQLPMTLAANPVPGGRRFQRPPALHIRLFRNYPPRRQYSNRSFSMRRRALRCLQGRPNKLRTA